MPVPHKSSVIISLHLLDQIILTFTINFIEETKIDQLKMLIIDSNPQLLIRVIVV